MTLQRFRIQRTAPENPGLRRPPFGGGVGCRWITFKHLFEASPNGFRKGPLPSGGELLDLPVKVIRKLNLRSHHESFLQRHRFGVNESERIVSRASKAAHHRVLSPGYGRMDWPRVHSVIGCSRTVAVAGDHWDPCPWAAGLSCSPRPVFLRRRFGRIESRCEGNKLPNAKNHTVPAVRIGERRSGSTVCGRLPSGQAGRSSRNRGFDCIP